MGMFVLHTFLMNQFKKKKEHYALPQTGIPQQPKYHAPPQTGSFRSGVFNRRGGIQPLVPSFLFRKALNCLRKQR